MSENAIRTKHGLDFEVGDSKLYRPFQLFRVGTCGGQFGFTEDSLMMLSVLNNSPGNGHLEDVFEWFEYSAKAQQRNLLILGFFNKRFYRHCIEKRGFIKLDNDGENLIKVFNKALYKKLLKNGNSILIKGSLKCV